jgi:hypothetical protein
MRKNIKRKMGAFGAIFRGVRHQGRHRGVPRPGMSHDLAGPT